MAKEACTISVSHSIVKVQENKRKAAFRNKENDDYAISRVDGCLIENGLRCDYLVSKIGVASVFVELKGSDVVHACAQLEASASCAELVPLVEKKIGFLVVCSKYPRFDTFVARAKQNMARKFRAGFHVVCGGGEFDIERVVEIDGPR